MSEEQELERELRRRILLMTKRAYWNQLEVTLTRALTLTLTRAPGAWP